MYSSEDLQTTFILGGIVGFLFFVITSWVLVKGDLVPREIKRSKELEKEIDLLIDLATVPVGNDRDHPNRIDPANFTRLSKVEAALHALYGERVEKERARNQKALDDWMREYSSVLASIPYNERLVQDVQNRRPTLLPDPDGTHQARLVQAVDLMRSLLETRMREQNEAAAGSITFDQTLQMRREEAAIELLKMLLAEQTAIRQVIVAGSEELRNNPALTEDLRRVLGETVHQFLIHDEFMTRLREQFTDPVTGRINPKMRVLDGMLSSQWDEWRRRQQRG